MAKLRDFERTLDTLRRLDPEHAKLITKAVGARGNHQPAREVTTRMHKGSKVNG